MGRSHLSNLHHISIPFLICLFYLLEKIIKYLIKSGDLSWKIGGIISISLALLIPYYFVFLQGLVNFKSNNLFTTLSILKNKNSIQDTNLKRIIAENTIDQLKIKYSPYIKERGITLLSADDTWYLSALKTVNNIESNNLPYYVTDEGIENLINTIFRRKEKYIFIGKMRSDDRRNVRPIYKVIYEEISKKYKFKENLDTLEVWEYQDLKDSEI